MKRAGWFTVIFFGWLAFAVPAVAAADPCDPRDVQTLCGTSAINDGLCAGLASASHAKTRPDRIEHLVAAATAVRADFSPATRLEGSRIVACRLIGEAAPEKASEILRSGLQAALAVQAKTERDEGLLAPLARTAVLQASAGFQADLDRSMAAFELQAGYARPVDVVLARAIAAKGFTEVGRLDLARPQFDAALAGARQLPELDGDSPSRWGTLQFITQTAAETGQWEVASSALGDLETASTVIDRMPGSAADKAGMHRAVANLRAAVRQKTWPPRP